MHRGLLAAGVAAGALAAIPAEARTSHLVAQIVLNGAPTGAVAEFERSGRSLFVPASSLRELGLAVDDGEVVDLARLAGVRFDVDERAQAVFLTTDQAAFVRGNGRRAVRPSRSAKRTLRDFGLFALAEHRVIAAAAGEPTRIVAQVVLNGRPTGAITELELDGRALLAPASTLRGLGLPLPPGEVVDLAELQGVRFSVDERAQILTLSADPGALSAASAGGRVRLGRSLRRSSREPLTDFGIYARAEPNPPATPPLADEVVAQIVLNGTPTGAITEFRRKDGALLAPAAPLRTLGLSLPEGETVDLARLPGVRAEVDERTQSVLINAAPEAYVRRTLTARPERERGPDPAAWGALVDYGFYAVAEEGGEAGVSGALDFRVFGPPAVFTAGFTARASTADDNGVRRLGTALTFTDAEQATRLTIGDFVSAGLAWTRPVRAAGISLATDFAIRPDLVLEPWPEISGAAAAPSAVDLYVNGVRRFSAEAEPGPFSITRAPMVDGQGNVTLVVTDDLGRQTVQSFQYYGSSELLRPGLRSYALEAGAVRTGFGSAHDSYRDAFAAFTSRWGLTDALTAEGHLLASEDVVETGAGVVARIAQAGVVGLAVDISDQREGPSGTRVHVTARRRTERYSIHLGLQETSGDFMDLAGAAGDPVLRRAVLAGASVFAEGLGSFSLNYNRQERSDVTIDVLGGSWSHGLGGRATLRASAFTSTEDWDATGASLSLSLPLGGSRYGGLEVGRDRGRTRTAARVERLPPAEGGWGWRAMGETGRSERFEGELRRLADYGDFGVGAAITGDRAAARAYGSGAMIWMGGAPRFSGRSGDSFALVETGMAGVDVTVENRPAGKTGKDGRLLIEGLPAYAASRIAVRPESAPLGAQIDAVSTEVRPPKGAGVAVRLPVRMISSATARLVMDDGTPAPVGSRTRLNGRDAGLVGYEGLVYLVDLKPENSLEVLLPGGRCVVDVPPVAASADLPDLGALVCRAA